MNTKEYKMSVDEFINLKRAGFNEYQIRELCNRLLLHKEATEDFKEARELIEKISGYFCKKKVEKAKKGLKIGSYKYKSKK